MAETFTYDDLNETAKAVQPAPSSSLAVLNDFLLRLENLFREGTQFLITLSQVSDNPALKSFISSKVKQFTQAQNPQIPIKNQGGGNIDPETAYNQIVGALEELSKNFGDITIKQLLEIVKTRKETVIQMIKLKMGG